MSGKRSEGGADCRDDVCQPTDGCTYLTVLCLRLAAHALAERDARSHVELVALAVDDLFEIAARDRIKRTLKKLEPFVCFD